MCQTLEALSAYPLINRSAVLALYPYYLSVNPIGVAIVALVVGLGIGVLLTWAALRTRQAEPSPTFDVAEPVVPAGVAEVLVVLPAAGVVVGPHDEVLEANATARSLGLVRGSRISVPELLQLVRIVRREGDVRIVDLQISRGARVASTLPHRPSRATG